MATQQKWKTIRNSALRHIWLCGDCETKASIAPEWYEDNGTPVCADCDCDMVYRHTEVQQPFAAAPELLERLQDLVHARQVEMGATAVQLRYRLAADVIAKVQGGVQ